MDWVGVPCQGKNTYGRFGSEGVARGYDGLGLRPVPWLAGTCFCEARWRGRRAPTEKLSRIAPVAGEDEEGVGGEGDAGGGGEVVHAGI